VKFVFAKPTKATFSPLITNLTLTVKVPAACVADTILRSVKTAPFLSIRLKSGCIIANSLSKSSTFACSITILV